MAHILAYTSPARGHLLPTAAILRELQQRGHRITLYGLQAELDTMAAAGFAARAIDARIEEVAMRDYEGRNPRAALALAVSTFTRRAELDAPDLRRALDRGAPDAVIVDTNCWGAAAAAEASGVPWALMQPYPMPIDAPGIPPFGPGLPPMSGPAGRLRDRLLRPVVLGTIERSLISRVNDVRGRFDLAPHDGPNDMFTRPPLVLYLTAEPFEYHCDAWPGSVVMVGPCEWEPPQAVPDWLAAVDRPVVLVTTSSEFQDDGRLLTAALEGLAAEDVLVVATAPAQDPMAYHVPGNARVERWLPHGAVLDRAVCAVTHGGMGVTQKALARGVPVCAVPFGRDQPEVARRVEVAGAGSRLPARRLTPKRLREAVHAAMECRPGAQRVAAAYRSAGGPRAAADAVERRLLAQRAEVV